MALTKSTKLDTHLTLQDKVRIFLNNFGTREIPITVEELAKELQTPKESVYQVINILRQRKEIEVNKTPLPNGRDKIVGIKINKLEPTGRTYRRAAERSGRVQRIKPMIDNYAPSEEGFKFTYLIAYLEKKLAIEDMKERALKAGLDESVITFEPDPIAEEGIWLLKHFTELKKEFDALVETHQMQGFDLEAEKQNVASLKRRLRQETDDMLVKNAKNS